MSKEKLYYIASQYSTCGNCILWWAEDAKGYTCNLDLAWKVNLEKAQNICSDPDRKDKYYLVEEIDQFAVKHYDFQSLNK